MAIFSTNWPILEAGFERNKSRSAVYRYYLRFLQRQDDLVKNFQVIVTGDFFQLPPVMKGGTPKFAFEAQSWARTIQGHSYNLTKVFRQKDQGKPS